MRSSPSPSTTFLIGSAILMQLAVRASSAGAQASQARQAPSTSRDTTDVPAIVEHSYAAIGGRDVWARKTIVEETLERSGAGGTIIRIYRVRDERDGRSYEKSTNADGTSSERGFDGQRNWERSARFRGYREASPPSGAVMSGGSQRLREYVDRKMPITRLSDEVVNGQRYLVLAVEDNTGPLGVLPVRFYLDPSTYLVRRTVYELRGAPAVQTFDDYRAVGGGRIRHFRNTSVQGGNEGWIQFKKIVIDAKVDPKVFQYTDSVPGKTSPAPSPPEALPHTLSDSIRTATFDLVWRRVYESYWDTTFNGHDWRSLRSRYAPRVAAAGDERTLHAVLDQMVGELGQSHFRVMNHEDAASASAWFAVDCVQGGVAVSHVDSAQANAGLAPGQVVLRVAGTPFDSLYRRHIANNNSASQRECTRRERALAGALRGAPDSLVQVAVREGDRERTVILPFRSRPSKPELPRIESRQLESGIVYVRIPLFLNAGSQVRQALRNLDATKGLVLDLRGNGGGSAFDLQDVANLFYSTAGVLARTTMRYGMETMTVAGTGEAAYRGRLVVLVNHATGSAAEILAAALQEQRAASVLGDTSAGAVLISNELRLPTGGTFQFALGDVRTAAGRRLEGTGVIPNEVVPVTVDDLRSGRDAAVQRAIARIHAHEARTRTSRQAGTRRP